MANVRRVPAGATLFLGGSGVPLAGWGIMWVGRLMTLAGTEPMFAAVHAPFASQGVLYYDPANELSFGWPAGGAFTTAFTLNTTNVWLLGFTNAAGTTPVRFHAANLTTGATPVHSTSVGAVADPGLTWNQTEVGTADGGGFAGDKRHATAAVFTRVYTDAEFNTVAAAKTSQSICDLDPSRMWDFNQASTATAVVNLMTGNADETTDSGTAVVADSAFDVWTFGAVPVAEPDTFVKVSGEWVATDRVVLVSGEWF